MIRVLIADDQELVRTGLRMILEMQDGIEVVAEAGDGGEAVDAAIGLGVDVVVMDVRMPRVDGVEATRRLRSANSPARVLMLTTFDADELVYDAIKAGASGFLLKNAPPAQLITAVRATASGESHLAPAIVRRRVDEFLRRPPPSLSRPPALDELTERELEVLRVLARGCSNAEVARALHLSEATVRTHVSRILAKLSLRDRSQAIVAAYETGLVEPGEPPRT